MGELLIFSKDKNELIKASLITPRDERTVRTIDRLLTSAKAEKMSIAFLFIQIERLSELRSNYRHQKIRDLVTGLLEILLELTPDGVYTDCTERNEFLIIMPEVEHVIVQNLAIEIHQHFIAFSKKIFKKENPPPELNIGIVYYPDDVKNRIELFQAGHDALYLAQLQKRSGITSYKNKRTCSKTIRLTQAQQEQLRKIAQFEKLSEQLVLTKAVDDLINEYFTP